MPNNKTARNRNSNTASLSSDYQIIAQLIHLLESPEHSALKLEALGKQVGLNAIQTQRLFSRWVGISPTRFQQYITAKTLRSQLNKEQPLLDLAFSNNLSSPSRVHDHIVQLFAMSPDQCRQEGENIHIQHGFHPSPFGECHIAVTEKGICWLAFTHPLSREEATKQLTEEWCNAHIEINQQATAQWIPQLFERNALDERSLRPLFVHVKGTNFQLKVWEALLKIPCGDVTSYGAIADDVGNPGAARAVGTAIGQNLVSWLIPCHRVIRATGIIGDYRWGHTRKQAMIARELSSLHEPHQR